MPDERGEKQAAQIIEDFLAELARAVPKGENREYSVKEMEAQLKGVMPILSALSQRWSLGILFLLYMKSLNFNELKDILHGINSRTLTDKLRMLEQHGILTRTVRSNPPIRVNYSLTKKGRDITLSCLPLLYELHRQK